MKTPEEIKKDAELCLQCDGDCNDCELFSECGGVADHITRELYDLVIHYEKRLAQAENEITVMRPAFIKEMKKYGCTTCEHYIPAAYTQECLGCGNSEMKHWKWNGVCPENTKEDSEQC